jgi:hypothetical protein
MNFEGLIHEVCKTLEAGNKIADAIIENMNRKPSAELQMCLLFPAMRMTATSWL